MQQIPLESGGNMAFKVGKITRQIRDIAKSHKIPVFLGCQINRGNQTTADKRPNRHLLRNSGEIFEVCDQLIMLYRDAVYTKDPSDRTSAICPSALGMGNYLCSQRYRKPWLAHQLPR
ncbi:DnaB-like helicase C-terminal domain-containing protein [Nostoc sp.]|uniref:DnaB-like helicase C-terminal domain-containing protein n=1 Tax=Nostoc sp. TaxID=1180 RepID=UPI002FFD24B2